MVEFTSESRKPVGPTTLLITLAVLALGAAAVYLVVRYQENHRPAAESVAIFIPGMVRPGEPDFEYYKNKIRIENAKASLGITFSKTRVAFISGIIANEGDRQLVALELKITLFDLYNKFSKERVTTPLRPGLGLHGKPMAPLEKRPFSVGIEAIEQLWDPKHVEIEITGLKYE